MKGLIESQFPCRLFVVCYYHCFVNSSFSDYNKEQFTPVKLEGADEQVSTELVR